MNYTGQQCFDCGNSFTKEDDVVVCPDCGTPYHRDCYKKNNMCINHELHESGQSWQRSSEEKSSVSDDVNNASENSAVKICPGCMQRNDASDENCRNCGLPLTSETASQQGASEHARMMGEIDLTKEYLGFNPEEDMGGGATLKEVSHFVGSNTFYYIPMFKRMKDAGTKISFNFICLFFPYFYFANRKMWLWALLTSILSVLFNVPAMIYLIGKQGAQLDLPFMQEISAFIENYNPLLEGLNEICAMSDWLLKIVMCLFANRLYFRFAVKSVRRLKANSGPHYSLALLRAKGGVSPINLILITIISMALFAAVYFAVIFLLIFFQQSGMI